MVDAEIMEQSMRLQERMEPAFAAALRIDATDEDLARAALALAIAKVQSLGLDLETTIDEATEIVGSA